MATISIQQIRLRDYTVIGSAKPVQSVSVGADNCEAIDLNPESGLVCCRFPDKRVWILPGGATAVEPLTVTAKAEGKSK